MELLDRAQQKDLLLGLSQHYPGKVQPDREFPAMDARQMQYNLAYLEQHGLVEVKWHQSMSRPIPEPILASITARGIDFISDDGGLSAILGVVTVKLHDDTIRQILIERVEKSEGEASAKASLIAKIKSLPAEALGKLTMDGLDAALAQAPRLIELLGRLLG